MLFARSDFLASHQKDLIRDLAGSKTRRDSSFRLNFLSLRKCWPRRTIPKLIPPTDPRTVTEPTCKLSFPPLPSPPIWERMRSSESRFIYPKTEKKRNRGLLPLRRLRRRHPFESFIVVVSLSSSLSFRCAPETRRGKKSPLNAPPPPHLTAFWRRRPTAGWPLSPLPHPPRCLAVWPAPPNNAAPDRRRRSRVWERKKRRISSPLLSGDCS